MLGGLTIYFPPMLNIEATKAKLAEADFFYRKLEAQRQRVVRNEPEAFGYYLSAFLSAARSVQWVLKTEQRDKYDEWVTDWDKSRSGDDLDLWRHFNKQRVETVKRKGTDVTQRSEVISHSELFSTRGGSQVHVSGGVPGTPLPEFYRLVSSFKFGDDEMEVVQACGKYLALMHKLVESFVARFGEGDR
jgi:hypothetical protein